MQLDHIDKAILRELQGNLLVVNRPFEAVARKIGISEADFFSRVQRLIEEDVIRKFGLRIDSKKVGYASTLVAMKVEHSRIDEVAEKLNAYEEVTHNYAREHEYNLWFTLIAESEARLNELFKEIELKLKPLDMLNLPVLRKFKINVKFEIR